MQSYITIIGVIQMRQNDCSLSMIQNRYHIGSGTTQLILKRFKASGFTLDELKQMEPREVEMLFYPPENFIRKEGQLPDFQLYYDRIHAQGSKVNVSYCWLDYKENNPDGYEQTQFYELYNRFVENRYGKRDIKMAVERIPGEKLYIDWIGDQPQLLVDTSTGELLKVHFFVTTLGVSSLIYVEAFLNEKLHNFILGTIKSLEFYGGLPKYLVPDNLKTAVIKHTKDELILQSAFSDLEDFYGTIVLPPPARKPKGKATVENHVRYLETHLIEKLKERVYTSLEELNTDIRKIVAALNAREFQKEKYSRMELFLKYDKPCMKPLPGGSYTVCDYKTITKIPDNYHVDYDNHYYSVDYTQCGKSAIIKATPSEIYICDEYNRLMCKHKRTYKDFPRYITENSHMRPEHLYYKEVNQKDGAYYKRWASSFGPNTVEYVERILKSAKHEEQAYSSCASLLRLVEDLPHGLVEEASRHCVELNSCQQKTFKQVLNRIGNSPAKIGELPSHENIRGKDFYK